jgi:2-polyprenyl-3-methyl-5-hydroxy-6-metoxy-1,4-benzoquinol methylase
MKKFNYENQDYLDSLNRLPENYWSKYRATIKKYLKNKNSKFLDVGCGNGINLKYLNSQGYSNVYGAEVSRLFVKKAENNKIKNVYYYDGVNLPFENNFFDLIGSFNVLEHTSNPEDFLKDQVSKLKKNGALIIACPNFLSFLFLSKHRRLVGVGNKVKNFLTIIRKVVHSSGSFERMPPVVRKNFQYDDDAIVVTNLLDLKAILNKCGCEIVYDSGFINYDTNIFRLINSIPLIRYGLPSCFVVAIKRK